MVFAGRILISKIVLRYSLAMLVVASIAAIGCGDKDLVRAAGKINIDGQNARSGRLLLTPVSAGERSQSRVAEDGAFLLRTEGIVGAKPGSYKVVFSRSLADEKNINVKIGDLPPEEITVSYHSPPDQPITILDIDETDLQINIESQNGWRRTISD